MEAATSDTWQSRYQQGKMTDPEMMEMVHRIDGISRMLARKVTKIQRSVEAVVLPEEQETKNGLRIEAREAELWDLQWLRQIARDPSARALPMAVAAVMSEYMNGRTRETFVGQARIANELSVSVDGVRKAQKRLVKGGHLHLVKAGSGGRHRNTPNTYRAVVRIEIDP